MDTLSLEQMREERKTAEAIFVKFINNTKYHKSYAFCFYEGEDGKYYDPRIRVLFNDRFITYPVGNKIEVLKLLHRLNENMVYNDVCMMFFVDRDYDESLTGKYRNLFETPCYSIENLYAQKACFCYILRSEFGLNIGDEDFDKCVSDFEIRMNEFNNYLLEFNALVYLRRKKSSSNSDFSFSKSIKTSHLVESNIFQITKSSRYQETIDKIKTTLSLDDESIIQAKIELEKRDDFLNNFRGKNQLDFFVSIVMNLKLLNRNNEYFKIKLKHVHIDITTNRLSELSQYAITPDSLNDFLHEHYKQFVS